MVANITSTVESNLTPEKAISLSQPSTPCRRIQLSELNSTPVGLSSTNEKIHVMLSPEDVVPLPKAGPRKKAKVGRELGKTRIVTSTPEKDALLAKAKEKEITEELRRIKKEQKNIKDAEKLLNKEKKREVKRKILEIYSSSEEDGNISGVESIGDSDLEVEEEEEFSFYSNEIKENDYVVVKYATKKSILYYIGLVEVVSKGDQGGDFHVNFLRRRGNTYTFHFPEKPDKSDVMFNDIVLRLPPPTVIGGTERAVYNLKFSVDLTKYNLSLR